MFRKRRLAVAGSLALCAGCAGIHPGARAPHPVATPDAGRSEIIGADLAFAAETAARGLEGWMEFMAPDAERLPQMGQPSVRGREEIRRLDAALFSDPDRRFTWEPTDGAVFSDGRHGFTTGRFRLVAVQADGSERVLSRGAYVTFWRREPDGSWRVILDTGAPDRSPAPRR